MSNIFSSIIRKAGLIRLADKIRYYILLIRTSKQRRDFKRINPDVILPPPYFLYETFNLNYFSFYDKSIETAKWLISFFEKYKKLENVNILDWGCGPGRVIRHLPSFIDSSCKCYGTDYNKKYIKWCKDHIHNVTFTTNQLQPPLEYLSNFFDIAYGISIFTHLSEEMHHAWFNELMRVLKPGGMLFLTLHGSAFSEKLTDEEKKQFDNGGLVVRGTTKEGHRTFAAFQSEAFVKRLIGENTVLEHVAGKVVDGKPQQDVWIIQKTKDNPK
ncbi:MAG: class I SAM-dependent methyltransferase [Bacteroidales bacterium]|jgi:ubiquinone/menaquinone biosynthesis C-methylase UbiE|nr:class I SAM-dependent methyltransferase [Bacteroidales bacterium]